MARVGGSGTPETLIGGDQAQDVILIDVGPYPAVVGEVVRSMTGLGPSAVSDLMAQVPCAVRTRIAPALAEALRVKLVAAQARAEVRAHGAAPEPEHFDVFLQDQGASKISVVRAVKMMTGLELREAVELVDDAPCLLKRKVDRDEAETIRHELVEAGAVVEIRAHDATAPELPAARRASSAVEAPPPAPEGGFDLVLKDCGPRKIMVIKLLRELTGLGLKEAKDMAESPGSTVKAGLERAEAARIERQLVDVGALVELRPRAVEASVDDGPALVDVFLHSFGSNKIQVIKEVRSLTGLGLKETKDLVEAAPRLIKANVDREVARRFQHQLTEVGAVVELRG